MSEDSLCEEVMVEILTRLPAKSLLRFRSVSNLLRSLIDSPGFIRIHTARSPQRLVVTHAVKHRYIEEYGGPAFCTIHALDQLPLCPIRGYIGITPLKFPRRNASILGSCNGILCLFDYGEGNICLWNPSIMRQLTLPDCPRRTTNGTGIGLGFDPITNDNKIVSVPYDNGNGESPFIYAMKTRAWCPIASPMPLYSKVFSRSWYLDGVLHWVVGRCSPDSKDEEIRYIMTLDLRTHVFGMIALPEPTWETQQLTTIQGSLVVLSRDTDDTWVWVRRDASWSLFFKSKTNQVEEGVHTVFKLTNNHDLLLDTFRDELQVYNPKTGARSTLVAFNDTSNLVEVDMYVESLQLADMGTACNLNQLIIAGKKKKPDLATTVAIEIIYFSIYKLYLNPCMNMTC